MMSEMGRESLFRLLFFSIWKGSIYQHFSYLLRVHRKKGASAKVIVGVEV